MSYIWFLLCFCDTTKSLSVDSLLFKSNKLIPKWQLLLFRYQMCVPYLFGAIAKMNVDWLFRLLPIKLWMSNRNPPWLFNNIIFIWFLCWGGLVF
eukprot:UN32598